MKLGSQLVRKVIRAGFPEKKNFSIEIFFILMIDLTLVRFIVPIDLFDFDGIRRMTGLLKCF